MRILATLVCCTLATATSTAQTPTNKDFAADNPESKSTRPSPIKVSGGSPNVVYLPAPIKTYVPEQLLRMEEEQLLQLYKCGIPNPVPCGYTPGTVIYRPGSCLTVASSKMFRFTAWQGKFINCGTMTNRQFGVPAIKAAISNGESWIDGKPTLVFDYENTSVICARYRDEVREICPGIYLGCMHKRTKTGPEISVWFALDARKLKGCCPPGGK